MQWKHGQPKCVRLCLHFKAQYQMFCYYYFITIINIYISNTFVDCTKTISLKFITKFINQFMKTENVVQHSLTIEQKEWTHLFPIARLLNNMLSIIIITKNIACYKSNHTHDNSLTIFNVRYRTASYRAKSSRYHMSDEYWTIFYDK